MGASDDLSKGQSTFMVEMSEAAAIMRLATAKSLVILDEVGRGTSTQDGLAIASAILESLSESVKCTSMFATHYHELVPLAERLQDVVNMQIEVDTDRDNVLFTHRLIPGGSGSSFGLEVAKMAGMPDTIVSRAKLYLSQSESQKARELSETAKELVEPQLAPLEKLGMDRADAIVSDQGERVLTKLRKTNPNRLTPLQALNLIDQLRSELEKEKQEDIFSM